LSSKANEFTYIEGYAGKGLYEITPSEIIPGSPIQFYHKIPFDPDIRKTCSGFKYNGYLFEVNSKNYKSLIAKLEEADVELKSKHNFQVFNKPNSEVRCIDISKTYNKGILYFDQEGILPSKILEPYCDLFPNYPILCNLQRNSTIRNLYYWPENTVIEIAKTRKSWLISEPVGRLGWCWFYGFSCMKEREKIITSMSDTGNPFKMYRLESDTGQYALKLLTTVGNKLDKRRFR